MKGSGRFENEFLKVLGRLVSTRHGRRAAKIVRRGFTFRRTYLEFCDLLFELFVDGGELCRVEDAVDVGTGVLHHRV